jgi:hypothetical protein
VTIPETLLAVLKNDGVVAIATPGADGPHLGNGLCSGPNHRPQHRPVTHLLD